MQKTEISGQYVGFLKPISRYVYRGTVLLYPDVRQGLASYSTNLSHYVYIRQQCAIKHGQFRMSYVIDCSNVWLFCATHTNDAIVLLYFVISAILLDVSLDLRSANTRACVL